MATNPIADLAQQVAVLTQTNAALVVAANNAIALANGYANAAGVSAGQAATVIGSLLPADGATKVGTPEGTVQIALDLRAKLADLAASGGSTLLGFVQAGTGAVARTQQAKNRDSIDAKDFGAIGDGVADDTAALQAAINAVQDTWTSAWVSNNTKALVLNGDFKITATLNIATNIIIRGQYKLLVGAGFVGTEMVRVNKRVIFKGVGQFLGDGNVNNAITASDFGRSEFEDVVFDNFPDFAINGLASGNNNNVRANVRAVRCGRKGTAAFTVFANSGSSLGQRSLLDMVVPAGTLYMYDPVTLTPYYVTSITATQVEVFPQVAGAATLTWYRGGVVNSGRYNDANAWDLKIGAVACLGTVLQMGNLYGHTVLKFSAEGCGIGIAFGSSNSAPLVNGVFLAPYFEGNDTDMLMMATNSFVTVVEPMDSQGDKYRSLLFADVGYTIIRQGGFIVPTLEWLNRTAAVSPANSDFRYLFRNTGATNSILTLHAPTRKGAGRAEVYLEGYGSTTFTINAPAGFTVQGVASLVLPSGLAANRKLEIVLIGTDYRVRQIALL